ncbi:hypothetical protein CKO28_21915 [Rhodovibrio sodomensis]|uniref:peptidyl-tRNA hydrolase n=1 Tax=Rhodovibrio sodomensis TaxID=1088 RepID=A0ABS1DJM2_9PROT|nr:hypothetical protein [Rhodovibrio sodomensis]
MPPGKAAAQAGHAFAASLLAAVDLDPELLPVLQARSITRVVLCAGDLAALHVLHARARASGLPAALFEDRGHVLPPDFDGTPIATALGIGPCCRSAARPITRGLRCWR